MPFNLDEKYVLATEQELGAKLPDSYRRSMQLENGGELETEDHAWQQFPIADLSDRKRIARTCNHILAETESSQRWNNFPANALAIADNGAGDRLVLLREGPAFGSAIYIWHHETGRITKLADDFSVLKT
jgi:hypothetical protein